MIMRKRFLWAATAVLLAAAIFRLILLRDVPPGLSQDEVFDAGMPAYILEGNHALFFRQAYGHEPLYHYWAIPFYRMFGSTVLTARLPVAFLGLLLVALTLRWAKDGFGPVTAVVAGAGVAVSWWPIVFSRVGIRPIMEPVLLAAAAIFWQKRPWLAGLLLGLSFYTYTGARVVLLIPLLHAGLLWLWTRRADALPQHTAAMRASLLVFAVSVVVAAPMQITLWLDPSLQQRVDQLSGPLDALLAGDVGPVLQTTLATLGVFSFTGDPRWTYSLPGRPLFDGFTALFFYGGLLLAALRLNRPRVSLALIWLAVTLLPSALTPQAPSTVRLVGAIPVVYVLPGLALAWLVRQPQTEKRKTENGKRQTENRIWLTAFGLLALALLAVNVWRTVDDGFRRWPAALETRLRYQTVLLDIARDWEAEPTARVVVADSYYEFIDADTLRHNLGEWPPARWVQTGDEVAGAVVIPAGAGDGRFYVPEFAPPPPDLLAAAGINATPLRRSEADPSYAVYALPSPADVWGGERVVLETAVRFDQKIALLGYYLPPSAGTDTLTLFTFWQVEAGLPSDMTAFVHLLDATDNLAAQHDGFDAAAGTLQPQDVVVQRHRLSIPPAAAGVYRLQIGLYTPQFGVRLRHEAAPFDRFVLPETVVFDGK